MKCVVFSDSNELLTEQRNKAFAAGLSMQLRSVFPGTCEVDGQFRNGSAVLTLSKDASDHVKDAAKRIKEEYEKIGVTFYDDVSKLLKDTAKKEKKETVEGVDTPKKKGIGTVEDFKGAKRAK